jgi:hypothetical protein
LTAFLAAFLAVLVFAGFLTGADVVRARAETAGARSGRGVRFTTMWIIAPAAATMGGRRIHADAAPARYAEKFNSVTSALKEDKPQQAENQNGKACRNCQQSEHRRSGFRAARFSRSFNDLSMLFGSHRDLAVFVPILRGPVSQSQLSMRVRVPINAQAKGRNVSCDRAARAGIDDANGAVCRRRLTRNSGAWRDHTAAALRCQGINS